MSSVKDARLWRWIELQLHIEGLSAAITASSNKAIVGEGGGAMI